MNEAHGTILVCIDPLYATPERRDAFERLAGGRTLLIAPDRATIEAHLDNVEIAIGSFPAELLAKAPRLQWYQQFGTGIDWMLEYPEAADSPFMMTNCSDDHCAVVADHLFALILATTRGIAEIVLAQSEGKWQQPDALASPRHIQLKGKTMLLVGLGSIALELAKRAAAFGMTLQGVRRDASKPFPGVDRIVSIEEMYTLLPSADIVAVSLPHTPETTRLFDSKAFAAMKPSALFFNIGRGSVVDETALFAALRDRTIAGGASDVFETEPLPETSPLWSAPNFIVSPHIGGFYDQVFETWIDIALDNLRRYGTKEPLRNVVDKRAGY